jgi:hypothetical protein
MNAKTLENAVNEILANGTKIVSFTFRGEQVKNVLIGSFEARRCMGLVNSCKKDFCINRAMAQGKYTTVLYGISNNEGHSVAVWDVAEISNFSYCFERHEHKTMWQKFLGWLDGLLLEIG